MMYYVKFNDYQKQTGKKNVCTVSQTECSLCRAKKLPHRKTQHDAQPIPRAAVIALTGLLDLLYTVYSTLM